MSVYVDGAENRFGRMVMCHMIADTPAELHAMARTIVLRKSWFQSDASMPHYDMAKSKRALAVLFGAVECDRRTFVSHMRRIRPTWPTDAKGRWL